MKNEFGEAAIFEVNDETLGLIEKQIEMFDEFQTVCEDKNSAIEIETQHFIAESLLFVYFYYVCVTIMVATLSGKTKKRQKSGENGGF